MQFNFLQLNARTCFECFHNLVWDTLWPCYNYKNFDCSGSSQSKAFVRPYISHVSVFKYGINMEKEHGGNFVFQ